MTDVLTTEQQDVANWDACDEHCRVFPRGDTCPGCLYDETISLRAECATKALEIERLERALTETHDAWTAETTARLQAVHERDCAVEDVKRLLEAIRLYVRSKKADHGRNALDWWRLQEIEKESAADVTGDPNAK